MLAGLALFKVSEGGNQFRRLSWLQGMGGCPWQSLAWGCVSPVSASAVIHMLSVSLHTAFRLSVCLFSSIYLFIFKDFFFDVDHF